MSEETSKDTHTSEFKTPGGEVRCWAAQGTSCHIKAITRFGDPVELNSVELETVIDALKKILEEIR